MKEKIFYIVIGVLVLMACLIGFVFFINTLNSSPKEDNTSTYSEISITDEAVKELYQNINASSDLSFNYSLLKDNNITNAYMLGVSLASALMRFPYAVIVSMALPVRTKSNQRLLSNANSTRLSW